MNKNKWQKIKQKARKNEIEYAREEFWTRRIVGYILVALLILGFIAGVGGYFYIHRALNPVESGDQASQEVTIPIGSTTGDIASILEEHGLIKDRRIFSYYLKFKNVDNLQAGTYQLSPGMDAETIVRTLEKGGTPIFEDVDQKITVVEGAQLEEIAQLIGQQTSITAEEFMTLVDDPNFIAQLQGEFPSLLGSLNEVEGLKHPLEGYLYPATYDYNVGDTVDHLIREMIAKTNLEYQKLKEDLQNTHLSFHQILTLASIIEKEGITDEDRGLISGVFYNRMNAGMPLQSDISILYALGEHKEFVTYDDLEVDSPYNLYQNLGLPPGPMNSPGLSSIQAAIYPTANDYYYFVADLDTQEIYYASTLEEHNLLVEEHVNQRQKRLNRESDAQKESAAESNVE